MLVMYSVGPYSYHPEEIASDLQLRDASSTRRLFRVTFSSACQSRYPEMNIVCGDYTLPSRDYSKMPLVILVHGLGDHSAIPCTWLARSLAGEGVASFLLYLPVHSLRLPQVMEERFPNHLTSEEWFEIYRLSVINIRQVIDWASRRPELDGSRTGLFGISMGGFVGAIAMALDSRITAGVLTVMGGNSAKIGRNSLKWRPRKAQQSDYDEYEKKYTAYLAEIRDKGLESVVPSLPSFLTDPLTFAHLLRDKNIYMINALWDEAIPRGATLDFWEACGRPPITWLPTTHASLWVHYPLIRKKVRGFFRESFRKVSES